MAASPTPKTAEVLPSGAPCVAVAFSGGADSTALLWVTARQAKPLGLRVVALHVHHGLQLQAEAWVTHAEQVCQRLAVPLRVARLSGEPKPGDSTEAWARRHRYEALAHMARAEGATLVLLAHHAEDQAETVLLQALRAGGPAGLAAMPSKWCGAGVHWARPWLKQPRAALAAAAARAGLPTIQDPSNTDPRFARSRLRHAVWPALVQAFPQAPQVLGEVARHAAQARALALETAALDLAICEDAAGRFCFTPWEALPPARRRNVLAAWLARRLPQGSPVALVDRLCDEWHGQGGRWPAPGGWLRARKRLLAFEASPTAKQ